MGYAGFSLKEILVGFAARQGQRRSRRKCSWHAEAQDRSWDEFNVFSNFLQ
jgi:hypothetical protein